MHLKDDTIGTVGPTDKPASGAHHVCMPQIAPYIDGSRAPQLRLLRAELAPEAPPREHAERLSEDGLSLLIAGADPLRRAQLRDELTRSMSESTIFEEATTFAEVLERAPASRMVILGGALDDIPARSMMRILGNRHPTLPVVNLEPAAAAIP
jgi:hypothetical protein